MCFSKWAFSVFLIYRKRFQPHRGECTKGVKVKIKVFFLKLFVTYNWRSEIQFLIFQACHRTFACKKMAWIIVLNRTQISLIVFLHKLEKSWIPCIVGYESYLERWGFTQFRYLSYRGSWVQNANCDEKQRLM